MTTLKQGWMIEDWSNLYRTFYIPDIQQETQSNVPWCRYPNGADESFISWKNEFLVK